MNIKFRIIWEKSILNLLINKQSNNNHRIVLMLDAIKIISLQFEYENK